MMFINYKAEMSIISAMMKGNINEVTSKLDKELLQSKEAIDAYWKIYNLEYKHKAVNERIVMEEYGKLGNTVMLDYITTCCSLKVNADDIPYYVGELRTAYLRKVGKDYADEITGYVMSDNVDVEKLTAVLRSGTHVEEGAGEAETLITPLQSSKDMYTDYYERLMGYKQREGIPIKSMPQLDDVMYGLNPQELTIICAQSGKGKTAFALNLARDVAIDQGFDILYANAEMKVNILISRLVSQLTAIELTEIIRAQHLKGEEKDKAFRISEAIDTIGASGFHVSDLAVMTVGMIRRDYKKMALAGKKPKVIFIDYLGRMEFEGRQSGKKEYEILQALAEECKIVARELDVCVVALAQLSESGTIEASKRIKNPCENLIFLEQLSEPADEEDQEKMTPNQKKYCNYKLTFHKARNAPDGKRIYVQFNKAIQKVIEVG